MTQEVMEKLIAHITKLKAKDFPVREIKTVSEDLNCLEILDTMLENDPPILRVLDKKGKCIGLLTLIDMLNFFAPITSSDLHDAIVHTHYGKCVEAGNLITQNFPRVYDEDTVKEIAHLMFKYKTTFLPRAHSEKDKEIIGVILLRDIVEEFKKVRDVVTKETEAGKTNE